MKSPILLYFFLHLFVALNVYGQTESSITNIQDSIDKNDNPFQIGFHYNSGVHTYNMLGETPIISHGIRFSTYSPNLFKDSSYTKNFRIGLIFDYMESNTRSKEFLFRSQTIPKTTIRLGNNNYGIGLAFKYIHTRHKIQPYGEFMLGIRAQETYISAIQNSKTLNTSNIDGTYFNLGFGGGAMINLAESELILDLKVQYNIGQQTDIYTFESTQLMNSQITFISNKASVGLLQFQAGLIFAIRNFNSIQKLMNVFDGSWWY